MRINHSLKNIFIGILSQLIIIGLGFLSRKVFLDNLGAQYLGVNGLLTNVLSMMVLIEGGIAISITYNLYKPLAEDNKEQIIALIQLYKKCYSVLALIVFLFSIGLYPFLNHLIKGGSSIANLTIVYAIFVGNSVVSYLNAHKWSLISADQRGYYLARVNLVIKIISMIGKIAILALTKNYILFLLVDFSLFLIQNIINGNIVNKRYPYIRTKVKYPLNPDIKKNIIKNVKAMFLQNIGGYLVFGTDNLLISSLISVTMVGIYSNYSMITQQLSSLVAPILGGIGSSIGNLIATEGKEKNFEIFKVSYFINFWLYSFCTVFLYVLLKPFIIWWLGKQYLLGNLAFLFIIINFYLNGMRTTIATFKNKAGLFSQDKYFPLIEGGVNLVASLIFIKFFGLAGVFIGTTLSTLVTVFWTQPWIVYKNLFKKTVGSYFGLYALYFIITIGMTIITSMICSVLIEGNSFIDLIYRGLITLAIPNLTLILVFSQSSEFKYINNILTSRFKTKLVRQSHVKL